MLHVLDLSFAYALHMTEVVSIAHFESKRTSVMNKNLGGPLLDDNPKMIVPELPLDLSCSALQNRLLQLSIIVS